MRISVFVKPFSRTSSLEQIDDTTFEVRVNQKPVDGKANDAVIAQLADFFNVPKSSVRLVSGKAAKRKIFDVDHQT